MLPSAKMLIYQNKLRFSRFGDALSAGFSEAAFINDASVVAVDADGG
uniref:Uncharacterized protein n=1 Tax=uncultured bacterium contig00036 TaxID=1181524 RepID=A0A806K0B7_9BACT|nr:hypothetical protein [uncultured bacterium contig00036]